MHSRDSNQKTLLSDTRGFSLIEMLVATLIFVIVVVVMFDLYLLAQRAQRTAASFEKLQDDMRFSINRMTDEVRDGSIDYEFYGADGIDSSGGNDILAIRTFDGSTLRFKMGTGADGECVQPAISPETKKCLLMQEHITETNPTPPWHSLTSDGVSVESLKFYITPNVVPFEYNTDAQSYDSNEQPRVRITLEGSGRIRQVDDRAAIFLQTLITTRQYRR